MKDIHLIELEFSLHEAKKLSATRVNSVLQTIGSLTQLPNLSIIIILKPETWKLEPDILKKNVFQMTWGKTS